MKKYLFSFSLFAFLLITSLDALAQTPQSCPATAKRHQSPAKTTYYINPQTGDDGNTGINSKMPWKTFKPVNSLMLAAGDKIEIMAPGDFNESLVLIAKGKSMAHVTVNFAPGTYNFYPKNAFKKQFHISNTNDKPYELKAIALYINNCRFVDIKAQGAKILLHGKMIETCVDHSENVSISGITYDYFRPTVSELQVMNTGPNFADLKIHPDSKYSIKDSLLTWEGEGWRHKPIELWQVLDRQTGDLQRTDIAVNDIKYAETDNNMVRAYFKKDPGFKTGLIYQNRDVTRDCAGIFIQRSKNIILKNIRINFMHGMGVVNQFCENISMDGVSVKPDPKSGRTCSAWADILHFSGCRGKIEIKNSYLSGANDDAINVHGTYLRIMESPKPNQVRVQFMHDQTYGFDAFTAGDSIAFIHSESLQQYADNLVVNAKKLNDKEMLLTLKRSVPGGINPKDVIENTTWTPQVWIHRDTITKIPTRGVLVTSRRKVIIEDNIFLHIHMSAISIADDAASWYESGMVKNLTIRHNRFVQCGEPVIIICPENTQSNTAVHQNISIINNNFDLQGQQVLSAKSTSGVQFLNNNIKARKVADIKDMMTMKDCTGVKTSGNTISQ
ncbi:right-handed parallel beta-helix repeat-containing protein [Mucilaginibacter sabulilitoris]|uniref:Right-handed parallel beta-helix repeat-containing protein n=1 Tax=Mucilaginibacter sabulilitoris TaxID=1173583 RepID=A0ABZ0TKS8_9SPHI|nr:right-handed parallel beta-helix repeat-containing protein [Mucilaginibacter sabulilitoris]WPU92329.1 right-handed parallel beta-helix repeat-containing protein [Mucilaginibacter sabulilitoris]